MKRAILTTLILFGPAQADQPKLALHTVPLPVNSYRLLAMSMDDDGFIWSGSIQRVVHRYDPRTGKVENIDLPYQATVSACICVGKKVYILGQTYPKLIVYDQASKKFTEVAYPSAKPDVWYGTEAIDGRHLYLFDRGGTGVIKWDTHADSGGAIPWPYKTPVPGGGRYEPRDKALWCHVWDFAGGKYKALGIARLDLATDQFTGFQVFPKDDNGLKPYTDPATTLFLPFTLKGKVVPFDFKEKRWCQFLDVPQYGKLFGFMGGPIPHQGRYYFSLSTYNGTDTGCDGKPYHFCNAILELDPQARGFQFLTLEAKDAYYQIAYMLSAGGEFYATGSNIREADGKLNQSRKGEVVFWQTLKPKEKPSTDWPCWRGPKADGVADGRKLPLRWSKTENIRWSVKLPGWGTSSPVVYGDRVFVTSHVKEGKKALLTLCFNRDTGTELWRHDFGFGVDQRTHEKSNLAVNTPAVTEDALYVAFGNADIARYSHDGKLVWVKRYIPHFGDPKMAWGYGLSPVVLDDSVLFPWNHHKGPCFLIGLDKRTGEIGWKKERPIGTAHATPLLVEHHGQKDILVPGQNRLTAFDTKTHSELWRYGEGEGPYNGEIISSPVYGDGLVFLQQWRESKIHAIRLRRDGQPPDTVWVSKKPGPVESSLLYYRELVYAWMDNGVLVCLDGKTGEELYRERLGAAANSSPIASDGHIYLSDNDGKTFVVKAGREFRLLETNQLGERISASPAITGNWVIYRTDSHLYCIGEAGGK
jgi:outer membrane protein assembly factor BamB